MDITMNTRRQTLIFRAEWLDWVMNNNQVQDKLEALVKVIEFGLTGTRPKLHELTPQEDVLIGAAAPHIENDYKRFTEYIKAKNQNRMLTT